MLYLFGEGANFRGTELRLFIFESAFSGAVAIVLLRHGFGGGAYFVFLVLQATQKRRRNSFFLAHFGGGRLMLRSGLDTLILKGFRLVGPLRLRRKRLL